MWCVGALFVCGFGCLSVSCVCMLCVNVFGVRVCGMCVMCVGVVHVWIVCLCVK